MSIPNRHDIPQTCQSVSICVYPCRFHIIINNLKHVDWCRFYISKTISLMSVCVDSKQTRIPANLSVRVYLCLSVSVLFVKNKMDTEVPTLFILLKRRKICYLFFIYNFIICCKCEFYMNYLFFSSISFTVFKISNCGPGILPKWSNPTFSK